MRQVHHSERAFTIEGFLAPGECEQLIALAEDAGFSAAAVRTTGRQQSMPSVRNNDRTLVESPRWVDLLWRRLSLIDVPKLDGASPLMLPKDLRFYRYSTGQRFKMHKDGPWTENGLISKLTLLIYLNDNFAGGSTVFHDFVVTPAKGSALIFIHDTWHEGAAVTRGSKYVLRSDVLYGPK